MSDRPPQIKSHCCASYQKFCAFYVQRVGEPDCSLGDGNRWTATVALQPLHVKLELEKRTLPRVHPSVSDRVGEGKSQIRGYSNRWKLVRTAPRCDFVLRVSQISLGNIYEKCQGEAGGWRSLLPSSTWLSTPTPAWRHRRVSQCVPMWLIVWMCVRVIVECLAHGSRGIENKKHVLREDFLPHFNSFSLDSFIEATSFTTTH